MRFFIMLKLTIINTLIASILIAGWLFKTNLGAKVFGNKITLDKSQWQIFERNWVVFFVLTALINLYLAMNAYQGQQFFLELASANSWLDINCNDYQGDLYLQCEATKTLENHWINFKFYGMIGLTILFTIWQVLWLTKNQRK